MTAKISSFNQKEIKIEWIDTDSLSVVWAQSQRPLDERFAKSIAAEFDPDKFGVIAVTLPNGDGHYHIIDGQHRKRAIEIAFGGRQKVPCQVFEASDPARAAELFDEINSHRRRTHTIDFFNVRVTAGDEDHVAVIKIVKANGLRIDYNRGGRTISAVQALLGVYRQYGAETLDQTLKIMSATWGPEGGAFFAPLIRGYAAFMAEYGRNANWQKVKEGVAKVHTPESFLNSAKDRRKDYGESLTATIKGMLVVLSNKGQKSTRRIPDPKRVSH